MVIGAPSLHSTTILILSGDSLAAALLAALIETLGYVVKFAAIPEMVEDVIRRWRPIICLVDGADAAFCNSAVLGRAQMRGISVVVYGPSGALDEIRALVTDGGIDTLRMPADAAGLEDALTRALRKTV
jgi:DNA-binding NtrC family response regulator